VVLHKCLHIRLLLLLLPCCCGLCLLLRASGCLLCLLRSLQLFPEALHIRLQPGGWGISGARARNAGAHQARSENKVCVNA